MENEKHGIFSTADAAREALTPPREDVLRRVERELAKLCPEWTNDRAFGLTARQLVFQASLGLPADAEKTAREVREFLRGSDEPSIPGKRGSVMNLDLAERALRVNAIARRLGMDGTVRVRRKCEAWRDTDRMEALLVLNPDGWSVAFIERREKELLLELTRLADFVAIQNCAGDIWFHLSLEGVWDD